MRSTHLVALTLALLLALAAAAPENDLRKAANGGDAAGVKAALAAGAAVDAATATGWTAMMLAAASEHPTAGAVIALLDAAGADTYLKTATGSTALDLATAVTREAVAAASHKTCAQVPLCAAAEAGDAAAVKALLEQGANPDRPADYGGTSILWASQGGHTDVVELVRAAGAAGAAGAGGAGGGGGAGAAGGGGGAAAAAAAAGAGAGAGAAAGAAAAAAGADSAASAAPAAYVPRSDRALLVQLLHAGAKTSVVGEYGRRPIDVAGNEEITALLLGKKRSKAELRRRLQEVDSPNPKKQRQQLQRQQRQKPKRKRNANRECYGLELCAQADAGDVEAVKKEIARDSSDANVNELDKDGDTVSRAPAAAAPAACSARDLAAASSAAASRPAAPPAPTHNLPAADPRCTAKALMHAAFKGHAEVVKLLLAAGADPHQRLGDDPGMDAIYQVFT